MKPQDRHVPPRDVVQVAMIILVFVAAFVALRWAAYLWLENLM